MPRARFSLGEFLDSSSEAHSVYWAPCVLKGRKGEEKDIVVIEPKSQVQIQEQPLAVFYPHTSQRSCSNSHLQRGLQGVSKPLQHAVNKPMIDPAPKSLSSPLSVPLPPVTSWLLWTQRLRWLLAGRTFVSSVRAGVTPDWVEGEGELWCAPANPCPHAPEHVQPPQLLQVPPLHPLVECGSPREGPIVGEAALGDRSGDSVLYL